MKDKHSTDLLPKIYTLSTKCLFGPYRVSGSLMLASH